MTACQGRCPISRGEATAHRFSHVAHEPVQPRRFRWSQRILGRLERLEEQTLDDVDRQDRELELAACFDLHALEPALESVVHVSQPHLELVPCHLAKAGCGDRNSNPRNLVQ